MPGATKFDEWLLTTRWRSRELAAPPSGSSLKAVTGDQGLPIVGHSLAFLRLGLDFWLHRYRTYGPVSWMGILGQRLVTLAGPDAAQVVLTNRDKAYTQQGWTYFIGPFFRRGLVMLDFDEHLLHRRIMQQAFTKQRLSAYARQVAAVAHAELAAWQPGPAFHVYPALKQLSLNIAGSVFMAAPQFAVDTRLNRAFMATVRAGTSIVRYPVPGGRWRAGLRGRRVLEEFFRGNLAAKRTNHADDLFSALCHARTEDGNALTDDDVVNHMIFLMMAAHDTSTIATTAAVYYLGRHPEWQDRTREESLAAESPLDADPAGNLGTLDMVIKESLRLVAPVPLLARKTIRDTEVLGHHLPSGTMVALLPWVNHMLPEYWPDPDRFDPERFGEARQDDKSHRYAWLPFGGGVHKCIGMHFGMLEVKTLLHEMLRRFRWTTPDGYQVRWDSTALPVPADGLPVELREIDHPDGI
jgi:cytochrome P450